MKIMISKQIEQTILKAQKNEITEFFIYNKLANAVKDEGNKKILQHIAQDEKKHYEFWKNLTKKEVKPSKKKIRFYYFVSRVFGLSFGLRLMERGEQLSQKTYESLKGVDAQIEKIKKDECEHEQKLLDLIEDKGMNYTGSVILGLNDALVELTGALAGLTLALQNTRIIAVVGLVTGIAASMSMAGSEYLSTKEEKQTSRNPGKASVFTGIAYIVTVIFLVLPFFLSQNPFKALMWTVSIAIVIIFVFTFYTSVARRLSFTKKFLEMAIISLGVAAISFGVGYVINTFFGIDV